MAKFSKAELRNALFFLQNFYSAGMAPTESLAELAKIQKKHADFWLAGTKQARNGTLVSEILKPILPLPTYAAIHAAESSGTVEQVLILIEDTYAIEETITKALRSLLAPAGMALVGLGMVIFFSVMVLPALTEGLGNNATKDPVMQFTAAINTFIRAYGNLVGIALVGAIVLALLWLRAPDNRQTAIAWVGRIPTLGPSLAALYYGLWCYHMALSTRAGIVLTDAIHSTKDLLPLYLRPSVTAVALDALRYGLARAADPSHFGASDGRHHLPHMVSAAFRMTDKTGVADRYFLNAGNVLVKQATRQITLFSAAAKNVILPVAASLIGGSIIPYFTQLGAAFGTVH